MKTVSYFLSLEEIRRILGPERCAELDRMNRQIEKLIHDRQEARDRAEDLRLIFSLVSGYPLVAIYPGGMEIYG